MKIKLEELMAFTAGVLDEVADGMYDWVIDNYEVGEDDYFRHYSFSLKIRQYFNQASDIRSEYMNWDLQIADGITQPIYPEEEMGSFIVDWELVHEFFIPYVWDNVILLFIEQEFAYYHQNGNSILIEEDYQNMFPRILGMYEEFHKAQETYHDDETHIYSKVIN